MNRFEPSSGAPPGALAMGETGRFLVPLQAEYVRYFRDTLFVAHSLGERLRRLASTLWLAPGRRGLLFTRHWPPTNSPAGQSLASVPAHLRRGLELAARGFADDRQAFPKGIDTMRGEWILCAGDTDGDHERAVVFLFAAGATQPGAILKLRSGEPVGESLRNEYRALQQLANRLPARLRAQVPVPLACDVFDNVEALLLAPLPGRAVYVETQTTLRTQRCATRHLRAAALWLADFHTATRTVRNFSVDEQSVGLSTLQTTGGWPPGERTAMKAIPMAAGHGDYWARNVLIDSTGTLSGVVDWEHYRDIAPVYRDLFDFVLTYGLNFVRPWSAYRRGEAGQAFQNTFVRRTGLARAVRASLRAYCGKLGLDPAHLKPLLLLYLLERANGVRSDEYTFMPNRIEPWFWMQCYTIIRHELSFALSG